MSKAAAVQSNGWLNRKTLIYATIAIVVIAAVVAIGLANRGAVSNASQTVNPDSKLKVGSTAPTFSIPSDAGPFDLASVSTPVFLEVFATWCPHCQHEVPIVDALAKAYAGKVAFIGISGSPYGIDGSSPENQADIDAWVQKLNVSYPVAFDQDLNIANEYLLGGYPTIVVIDQHKVVRYINSGEQTPAQLQKAIEGVLSSAS